MHLTPGGFEKLYRELPHEPKTDDYDRFPQPRVGLTYALKSNRSNSGVTGRLKRNSLGDFAAEIPRDEDHFGVRRVADAGASDWVVVT